jgi:hypothetical protein
MTVTLIFIDDLVKLQLHTWKTFGIPFFVIKSNLVKLGHNSDLIFHILNSNTTKTYEIQHALYQVCRKTVACGKQKNSVDGIVKK